MTSRDPSPEPWRHRDVVVGDVRLHCVEAGIGPLVILLHGFPEFWYSWRHQIPAVAVAGRHVVAVDMRGYNTSDKPVGVANYSVEALVSDIVGLVAELGHEKATLVGHDWGGVVAWHVAARHPGLVEKLAILNAAHPAALKHLLFTPRQLFRSLYMFAFQVPWLPEWLLRARGYALLERIMRRDPVRPGAFSDDDIRRYKMAMGQPGALRASIDYYRAAFRKGLVYGNNTSIACETMVIWGMQDRYLGSRVLEGLSRWVPRVRIERLPDASHWVQMDAPDEVNRLLLAFLES